MTTTERARMEPPEDPELQMFWDGTRRRELLIPHCRDCGTSFWYPRVTCPACLSEEIDWRVSSGAGEIHAVSVMARGPGSPYAVVLVDIDGIRLMSNMIGVDPSDVAVGMRVRLTWEALSDSRHLWLFEPGG